MPNASAKKVALITGCSSGFGLVSSVEMAKAGFHVFASMRNLNKRAKLEAAARTANVTIDIIELDVTKDKSVKDAINSILSKTNRIDVLVNNAGIYLESFMEEVSLEELREIFETNFFGLVAVTKAVYPKMREQHSGYIINISSLMGLLGLPNGSSYAATKFATEGFSESLYYEALADGIHVSLIESGVARTAIHYENRKMAAKMQDPNSPHQALSKEITEKFDKFFEENAIDPAVLARTIVQIAQSDHPKLRYVVCTKIEKFNLFLKWILPATTFAKLIYARVCTNKKN